MLISTWQAAPQHCTVVISAQCCSAICQVVVCAKLVLCHYSYDYNINAASCKSAWSTEFVKKNKKSAETLKTAYV